MSDLLLPFGVLDCILIYFLKLFDPVLHSLILFFFLRLLWFLYFLLLLPSSDHFLLLFLLRRWRGWRWRRWFPYFRILRKVEELADWLCFISPNVGCTLDPLDRPNLLLFLVFLLLIFSNLILSSCFRGIFLLLALFFILTGTRLIVHLLIVDLLTQ